jgi:hypothetical protein
MAILGDQKIRVRINGAVAEDIIIGNRGKESFLAEFGARLADDLRQPIKFSRTSVCFCLGR